MRLRDIFKKETAADRADWLKTAVRAASTAAQTQSLGAQRAAQRSFETAETPVYTDSWQTTTSEINEDLARSLPIMRARSLGHARNNEWAANYLIQLEDNVLGPAGVQMQARMLDRNGEPDKAANAALEAAFATWGQRGNCDVSGKLTWREVEALALASLARNGELMYRHRPGTGGPHNFKIQLLNPALLDVNLRRDYAGNRVRMGIEIDADGKPLFYWFKMSKVGDAPSDLISVGQHVRIPASQIRHHYLVEEIDQLRGIPWLTIGARSLWLAHDFEEAAQVASSNAAKRQGFFVSPTGEAPPGFADTIISSVLDAAKAAGKVLTPDEIQSITAAAEKHTTTMPGQFDTLPTGYDFTPFESKWPDINADGYVKQQVRRFAAARGVSYVTVGNDLEAVNYSSARVGIVAEREHFKAIQAKLIGWLHTDVVKTWLVYAALSDRALKPGLVEAYQAAISWQPRRWTGIDPVKEATADEINLRMRLTSRRRIILGRGEDPDEIAAEVAVEEKLYGSLDPENTPRPLDDPEDAPPKPTPRSHLQAVN